MTPRPSVIQCYRDGKVVAETCAITRTSSDGDLLTVFTEPLNFQSGDEMIVSEYIPTCSECGDPVRTREREHKFNYGDGEVIPQVVLKCVVPVRECSTCGATFLDWVAEDIIDETVKKYQATASPR